jgi:hypothetical protein
MTDDTHTQRYFVVFTISTNREMLGMFGLIVVNLSLTMHHQSPNTGVATCRCTSGKCS